MSTLALFGGWPIILKIVDLRFTIYDLRNWPWLIFAAISLVLLVGCQDQSIPVAPAVTVTAAETSFALGLSHSAARLPELAPFGETPSPTFLTANGETLLTDVANGDLTAALVHHLPESANELWQNPIVVDGIVLAVHPDNSVGDLSLAEAQAIFSGRVTNWADLGGANEPIVPIVRERGSGARAIFNQRVMGEQRVTIDALIRPNPTTIQQTIAEQTGAIGYLTLGSLATTVATKTLSVDGVLADPTTLADQSYPLAIPLYWVSAEEPTGQARALLGWYQSEAGQVFLGEWFGRIRQ